jgi:hypothetical protein
MEACLESRVLGHIDQEVDQIHGRIVVGDSSHRIVVVEDSLEAKKEMGRDEMEGLAVKEEVRVEMSSDAQRVSAVHRKVWKSKHSRKHDQKEGNGKYPHAFCAFGTGL